MTQDPTPTPGPDPRISHAPGRRPPLRMLLAGGAAVLLLAAGTPWVMSRWSTVSINDARIAAGLVTLSSEVSGRIDRIGVVPGDRVQAGAALVAIDPEQAALMVKGMEARLTGLDAQTEQLRAQQRMIEAQLASRMDAARAQIAAAEANHASAAAALANAETRHARIRELAARKVAATQDLEAATTALDTARQQERATAAAVQSAEANLSVVRADHAQLAVLERQIATLAADRAALEAERAQKDIDLAHRQVTASFDGIVDATFVDQGEYVTPGTRLLIYHHPGDVWVDANVKETDFEKIALGAPATITVDAFPGRTFHGTVERLGGAATSQFALLPSPNPSGNFTKVTQRLPIRVSIDPEGAELLPGMMVELSVDAAG